MLFFLFSSVSLAWDAGPEGWSGSIQWCADEALRADVEEAWAVWQSVSECTPISAVQVEDCDSADIVFSPGESAERTSLSRQGFPAGIGAGKHLVASKAELDLKTP